MSARDQITIQSPSILWVGGVGVGLLTLAFVLGVQVGKQSAALHKPTQQSAEEDLKDLPEPLVDQLKIFEGDGPDKLVPTPKVDAAAPKEEPKPEAKAPEAGTWTLQLVATTDAAEAKRITDKAKAAGFATTTQTDQGQLKVRLAKPMDRATTDQLTEKLKKAGFKPFPVKAD
jgi:cell division protein FtsN